jgi:hypothetical protein
MDNNPIEALINYCAQQLSEINPIIIELKQDIDNLEVELKITEAHHFNGEDGAPNSVTDINNADRHQDVLLHEYAEAFEQYTQLIARKNQLIGMLQSVRTPRRGGKRKSRKIKTVKKRKHNLKK